jgi:hypothetical protein
MAEAPGRAPTPVTAPRVLIAVRTHQADAASLAAYDRYATVPGASVTFSCDERAGVLDMGGRRKTGFDLAWLAQAGLFAHPQCGWRCGDYNFYRLRQAYPDFDYYWLIEPDVVINVTDIGAFFAGFTADHADYLCGRFGPRQPHWDWHAEVAPDYPEVYGGVFPITRLSGKAIDFLFAERQRLTRAITPVKPVRWPNDESFVASALMQHGFACADLNAEGRVVRTEASLRTGAVHDASWVQTLGADGLIYHPVRDLGGILAKAETALARFHKIPQGTLAPRGEALWLIRTARSCLGHPAMTGAAVVPLTLARQLAGSQGGNAGGSGQADGAENPKAVGAPQRSAAEATHLYRRHFGPPTGAAVVGSLHVVWPKKRIGTYTTAATSDFELGRGFPLAQFPRGFALPFAFDLDNKLLMHTVHIQPHLLMQQPFLYVAQRQRTHVVANVPFKHLEAVHGTPDPAARPVFIFSIGRTGSTLLGRLIECVTPRAFLEPDTVTQLASLGRELAAMPASMARQLVWSSVAPFQHTYLGEGVDGPCVVKLRSQANGLASRMAAVFPNARFVFMLRDRAPWARSTFRAFRISPQAVAGRLAQGVKAVQELAAAGVNLELIRYEDVVADPRRAVARLMGLNLEDDPVLQARLDQVMAQDSQAEAVIAREKTSLAVTGETEWMAEFEAIWQQKRPAALIDTLGLTL